MKYSDFDRTCKTESLATSRPFRLNNAQLWGKGILQRLGDYRELTLAAPGSTRPPWGNVCFNERSRYRRPISKIASVTSVVLALSNLTEVSPGEVRFTDSENSPRNGHRQSSYARRNRLDLPIIHNLMLLIK